ncbi:MAG: hypothetical protein Q9159_005166 [Coniocarpon cinnabarinum]
MPTEDVELIVTGAPSDIAIKARSDIHKDYEKVCQNQEDKSKLDECIALHAEEGKQAIFKKIEYMRITMVTEDKLGLNFWYDGNKIGAMSGIKWREKHPDGTYGHVLLNCIESNHIREHAHKKQHFWDRSVGKGDDEKNDGAGEKGSKN